MLNWHRQSSSQSKDQPAVEATPAEDLTLALQGADGVLAMPDVAQYPMQPKQSLAWRWLLISLMSCVAASGAAVGAFVWLINLPPTADCNTPTSITTDRAQLYCAQLAAQSGELDDILASLELVGSWDSSHPLFYEVQSLVEQWSWVVLREAQQKLYDSDLDRAVELIEYIPASSAVYETAQASLQSWNSEWEKGDAIWQDAQTALKNQDWGTVSRQILALSELQNRHWRVHQVQRLSQQIRQEQQGRRQLSRAIELADGGGATQLGGALKTASQIDPATYAYAAAQPFMDRWSDWLLNLGLDKWYAAELDAAIRLGQTVGANPSRAKAAQELIWLSRSRQMAQQSVGTWRTSPDQLVRLYRAMVVANQIPADSPYYPQAQSSVGTWRTHLADLGKLQTAQLPGRFKNLETLKLAVGQAAQIPEGHPRRVQAQTLIAHWRLEIERLEDRPYLAQAHRLAKVDTVEGLQQAIETASQISFNRALRHEAQSWIYVWRNRIEILQDRPILAEARDLAAAGNYSQAIARARDIKAGRALFGEAESEIAGWQRQIYAIEQARQRALRRAAEPRNTRPETTQPQPVAAPTSGVSDDPFPQPAATFPLPQMEAPAPIQSQPGRRLPRRIETVPGDAPASGPASPTLTPAQPPTLESPPRSPAGAAAPASPEPVAPPPTNPLVTPAPIERPPPNATPGLSVPIPAAPAPQLPGVPQPDQLPQPEVTAPAPDADPEAEAPAQPAVSVAPTPEQTVGVKTTKDTTVLFTGSLYAGR